VNVNVIDNAGVDVQTERRPDGSIDVMIDTVDGRLPGRAKSGRGSLVKATGSRREGNALIG
jgi:hypothetical protein